MRGGPTFKLSCGPCNDDPGSLSFAVTDDAGRVVGAAKLTPGSVWELESLSVAGPGRYTVAAALCHGIVQTLRVNRARDVVVKVDVPAREALASFGLLPSTTSVTLLLDRQRRVNPEGYRLVTQGDGLDDVALPHPAELLTALAGGRELAPTG